MWEGECNKRRMLPVNLRQGQGKKCSFHADVSADKEPTSPWCVCVSK